MTKMSVETPPFLDWLIDTGTRLNAACGTEIDVLELRHTHDEIILSAWAKHFRKQYCADGMIDELRENKSRKEYLEEIIFPSKTGSLGSSIRSGDFSEILLADYFEWRLNFWVPRLRWNSKYSQNSSGTGCDVIGFYFARDDDENSPNDILAIIECKSSLSGKNKELLQDAITSSAKDPARIGVSLNFLKRRLLEQNRKTDAEKIGRFQRFPDKPYKQSYAAAAVLSTIGYDETSIQAANSSSHPHYGNLKMIVVKGDDLMALVHDLYQRAADEA